jgi:DNA repair exonuclease SbcCD nuclease subunit
MKLLHFADLHLDTQFAWAPRDLAAKRRQGLRDTLENILQLAKGEAVDVLLCGGDLYEQERFSPDTAEFLRKSFAGIAPMPVYISPGNHDWYGPKSLYATVDWSPNVHLFTEDKLSAVDLGGGVCLWGAAHRAPANTDDFLTDFHVDRGGINLALFHGSENGGFSFQGEGKEPYAPFSAAEVPAAGLVHLFTGHYHRPSDGQYQTYPGNPDPLTFGEDGERGAVVATVGPNGVVHTERRRVASSEVHDLDLDVTECTTFQDIRKKAALAVLGLHGAARMTVHGQLAPDVELDMGVLAETQSKLDALLVREGRLVPGYDLKAIQSEQTVRGQFVRDVTEKVDDEVLRERVLITGLRALAGRQDLGVG